jgi:hypothetical protein
MTKDFAAFYGTKDKPASHFVPNVPFCRKNDEILKQHDRVYPISIGTAIGFALRKPGETLPPGKEAVKNYKLYRRIDQGSVKYSIDSVSLAKDLELDPEELMKHRYSIELKRIEIGNGESKVETYTLVVNLTPAGEKTRRPRP